jgi:PhzF family phenazine biosynthesis protein
MAASRNAVAVDSSLGQGGYVAMKIPLYQIDAFAARPFSGNPAAVCPLEQWLDEATLQAIAAENNLSETAFFVAEDEGFHLRWFTPAVEVELCGHATLATGWVIFNRFDWPLEAIDFRTRSGMLTVSRDGDRLAMDFPARPATRADTVDAVASALGAHPREVRRADNGNALAVFDSAAEVKFLVPDFARLGALDMFGVIATAPGEGDADFVSRYFAPRAGVPEDPVTGSAHCTLVPYWAERLGKEKLFARQVSKRGGELWCEDRGARTIIAGRCVPTVEGTLTA